MHTVVDSAGANVQPRPSARWARWRYVRYRIRRSGPLQIGGAALLVLALVALCAPAIAPYGPSEVRPLEAYQPPSAAHWFGTDRTGVDVFSRTVFAARLDLLIALGSTLLGALIGVPLGTLLGYFGGRWDNFLMRFLEVIQSFPAIVLAMAIVAAAREGVGVVVLVIAFISAPFYLRLVRAEMLSKRRWEFVEAAEAVGNSHARIAFVHLLPNCLSPALVYGSLNAGYAIIVAATLGFLGLGIGPGQAEWGLMVYEGSGGVVSGEWWLAFFPGLAMAIAVGSFYLLGDGLRDLLDPGLRI
jgi:peptide/nickel transport system permease protein